MARPLRVQYPGAWYHITSRGNERKEVYKSKRDRDQFLSYLESAHERYGAGIHVYCLMNNHYHLLLETPRSNLSQILHHINGAYTTYFNIKRNRSGHLFQGRYKAILVDKDAYCKELSRYIHLNPVRAGMVEKPSEYTWSSYAYYIGLRKRPEWLTTDFILGYFGKSTKESQKTYRQFHEKAIGGENESPLKDIFASTFLGGKAFIDEAKEKWIGYKNFDIRNQPASRSLIDRPSFEEIKEAVKTVIGEDLRISKKFCLYVSQYMGGYSLKQIGNHFNMKGATVSQSNRRLQVLIDNDKKRMKIFKQIKTVLQNVE